MNTIRLNNVSLKYGCKDIGITKTEFMVKISYRKQGFQRNTLFTYAMLRKTIFISSNFAGLRVIGATSILRNYGVILRNFYKVIYQNFEMITRNQRNFNFAKLRRVRKIVIIGE